MQPPITQPDYASLLSRVRDLLAEARERARLAVEYERVRSYWEVGGVLRDQLSNQGPTYGRQVLRNLATDLEIPERLLYEMMQMHAAFPKLPSRAILSWSHYRKLLPLSDPDERTFYLRHASAENLSVNQLELAIKGGTYQRLTEGPPTSDAPGVQRLHAKRGEPYVYRVAEKPDGTLTLDLGFHTHHRLTTTAGLEPGQVVRSTQDARYAGGYRIEPVEQRRRMYAFSATIHRLIDGDTFWATADCGFHTLRDIKLRLRGIDTPELKTPAGEAAKQYTAKALQSVRRFVIVTTSIDLYDRYLTDVFYLPGEDDMRVIAEEGRYLNRELMIEGLARLWTKEGPPEF